MLIREIFAAGIPKAFNHPGNYFRIKRVTGLVPESLDCTFFKNGAVIDVDVTKADPGDFAFVPDGFDRVEVVSTIAQDVTVQIARGRVGSDRVMGDVSVIDVSAERARNGSAFSYGTNLVSGAGLVPVIQLWNLPGSGKNLVVDELVVGLITGAQDVVLVSTVAVALAALVASPNAKNRSFVASVAAQIRIGTQALPSGVVIAFLPLNVGVSFPVPLKAPVIVPPGSGLNVSRYQLVSDVAATFSYYEEPI